MLSDTILISFAGSDVHKDYQRHLHDTYGRHFGLQLEFDMDWIKKHGFYDKYKDIFSYQKYAGYFLWKPLIILDTIQRYPEYKVLYCDANMVFKNIEEFKQVFWNQMSERGIFFIKHWNRINKDWTKKDTFVIMDADIERYHNAQQVWSVLQGWTTADDSILAEYLSYCTDEYALTDLPNQYGENYPGFTAHRWEQSILSILVEKYHIPAVSDLEIIKLVDKDYNLELLKLKEEVDRDPLRKV